MRLVRITTLHPVETAQDIIQVWVLGNQFGTDCTPLKNVIGKRANSAALKDFLNSLLSKSLTVQVSYWTETDADGLVIGEADPAHLST